MGNDETASPNTPEYLTLDEIATHLRVSGKTVRRLIEHGRLDAIRMSPLRGHLRVSRQALAAFIARARVGLGAERESGERDS